MTFPALPVLGLNGQNVQLPVDVGIEQERASLQIKWLDEFVHTCHWLKPYFALEWYLSAVILIWILWIHGAS